MLDSFGRVLQCPGCSRTVFDLYTLVLARFGCCVSEGVVLLGHPVADIQRVTRMNNLEEAMRTRRCACILSVLLLSGFLPACEAIVIGRQQEIHKITDVKLTGENNEPLYLGYATTVFLFGGGVALVDEGYVLGIQGSDRECHRLPDERELARYQKQGLLPDPLPAYHIGFWQYIYGFWLWIALGLVATGLALARRRTAARIREAVEVQEAIAILDLQSVADRVFPVTSLEPLPFFRAQAVERIRRGECVLCRGVINRNETAFYLVGRHKKVGKPEVKSKVLTYQVTQKCSLQACYIPTCLPCLRKYSLFTRIGVGLLNLAIILLIVGVLAIIVCAVIDAQGPAVGVIGQTWIVGLVIGFVASVVIGILLRWRLSSSQFVHINEAFPEFGLPNTNDSKLPQWATTEMIQAAKSQ